MKIQMSCGISAGADAAHEAGTFLTGCGRARDEDNWSQRYTCIHAKRKVAICITKGIEHEN
jgi:hypothetical protein